MDTECTDSIHSHEELLDTDFMDPIQLYEVLLAETQLATTSWGSLLVAGGGSAKQKKCYWQPILYECTDGAWSYVKKVGNDLKVPQPGNTEIVLNSLHLNPLKNGASERVSLGVVRINCWPCVINFGNGWRRYETPIYNRATLGWRTAFRYGQGYGTVLEH